MSSLSLLPYKLDSPPTRRRPRPRSLLFTLSLQPWAARPTLWPNRLSRSLENPGNSKAPRRPGVGSMSRFRALLRASIDATKRALLWSSEDLMPPNERSIFNFNSKEELKRWHLYADSEFGGLSSASLEIIDAGNGDAGNGDHGLTGVFSGTLSVDVPQGTAWRMNRSGFCGMRSKKSNGFIDLEPYDTIALRLRGDGRSYISTIYTENWVNSPWEQVDNSWQAFVFVPKGQWHIAKIPLDGYLSTWKGNVLTTRSEMNPSRIVGMSLSVNAEGAVPGAISGPGDFRLEIDWIKALRT